MGWSRKNNVERQPQLGDLPIERFCWAENNVMKSIIIFIR